MVTERPIDAGQSLESGSYANRLHESVHSLSDARSPFAAANKPMDYVLPKLELTESPPTAQAGTEHFLNLNPMQIEAVRAEQRRLSAIGAPLEHTMVGAVAIKLSNNPHADKELWPDPIDQNAVNQALLQRRRAMGADQSPPPAKDPEELSRALYEFLKTRRPRFNLNR